MVTKADKTKVNQRVIEALALADDAPLSVKAQLIERVRNEAEREVESARIKETVRPAAF